MMSCMKRCPRCELEKPLEGSTSTPCTGSARSWCKTCETAARRAWYAARPEVRARSIEQAIAYREQHREKRAAKQLEWRAANEDRRKARRARRARPPQR